MSRLLIDRPNTERVAAIKEWRSRWGKGLNEAAREVDLQSL